MTSPAQDDTPGQNDFDLDPQAVIASLRAQRNDALDEAAQWRAAALQERAVTQHLAKQVADLQEAADAPGPQPPSPRKRQPARKR